MYLRAGQQQRLALLQGLMDSDGHVYPDGRAEFTSKSIRLAEGVRELALSLGMKATVQGNHQKEEWTERVSKHYRVRFTPTMPVAALPRKVDVCDRLYRTTIQGRHPYDCTAANRCGPGRRDARHAVHIGWILDGA